MEIIPPYPTVLVGTPDNPYYIYTGWATATYYAQNAIIRDYPTGAWRDYRARLSHTSASATRPPHTSYWEDLGPSATTGGVNWSTNVALSLYPVWSSGQALNLNAIVHDQADHHDYSAATAISAGDNTVRPSEAVKSTDTAIAARWVKLGAANAWAILDHKTNSYLIGQDSLGAAVNPTFSLSVSEAWYGIDRICLAGLSRIASVKADVYVSGSWVETITQTITPGYLGRRPRTVVLPVTKATAATSATIDLTITHDQTYRGQVGLVVIGKAYAIANTQWGVDTGILNFSRIQRNEAFGTVDFLQRGSARRLRATCLISPGTVTGDDVQEIFREFQGQPVFFDFNNGGTTFDRLRVFGFTPNFGIAIPGLTYETLSIDIEGLVE